MYERFIARQPIFDRRLRVLGYELLFRNGPDNHFTPTAQPAANVIVDSTMLLRLDSLTGPGKAFLNMSHDELRGGSALLLSSSKTVIEITEQIEPNAETIRACQDLHLAGYQLALDGFQDVPHWQLLIRFASFLKVDFQVTARDEQEALAKKFSRSGRKLTGKPIETQEEFRRAKRAGYAMFQGFFFLRPQMVIARDLPASKLNSLRLLQESVAPELRYGEIEDILKQEPALLYKLLRYLNSPALGLCREVRSVPHAVALLGEKEFRRWVTVVAVVAASMDEPVEVLRSAITRAYFCEGLAQLLFARANSAEFFLMGLLSLLDVLFARPLAEILDELPLSDGIRTALTGGSNMFRDVYEAALTCEQANWSAFHDAANRAKLSQALVTEKYEAALRQASSLEFEAT